MGEDVPVADGYDWLLNRCVDLDQAEHAGHLDSGIYFASCFHCQLGEGRRTAPAPAVVSDTDEAGEKR